MHFTTTSLAKYLGVSRFTVFKQLKRGVIKFDWLSTRVIIISQEEADKWLKAKHEAKGKPFFPFIRGRGRPRKIKKDVDNETGLNKI